MKTNRFKTTNTKKTDPIHQTHTPYAPHKQEIHSQNRDTAGRATEQKTHKYTKKQ